MKSLTAITMVGVSLLLAAPAHAGEGVFDIQAPYSHTANDDPIVFPDQPGASHEHDFLCNKTTDAFSTGHSLLAAGLADPTTTLCTEGTRIAPHNFSGYWVPSLYINGIKVNPDHAHIYYRDAISKQIVEPFPTDFRLVLPFVGWFCDGTGGKDKDAIPADCLGDKGIKTATVTPPCWDGRLDSPDHRSHVTTMNNNDCPASHPRKLPRLTVHIPYQVQAQIGHPIRFDDVFLLAGPGHMDPMDTYHLDVMSAWDPDRLQRLIDECLKAQVDCKRSPPPDPSDAHDREMESRPEGRPS